MPYIHWESFSSQVKIGEILDGIKQDISKKKIRRSNTGQANDKNSGPNSTDIKKPSPSPSSDHGVLGTRDAKMAYYEEELLKTYLYKRWPVHMRRTLAQYYYSYLADTKTRDVDQVVIRARARKLQEEAKFEKDIKKTGGKNGLGQSKNAENIKGKNDLPETKDEGSEIDENSPVVMIDQLWLWVVSPGSSPFLEFGDVS